MRSLSLYILVVCGSLVEVVVVKFIAWSRYGRRQRTSERSQISCGYSFSLVTAPHFVARARPQPARPRRAQCRTSLGTALFSFTFRFSTHLSPPPPAPAPPPPHPSKRKAVNRLYRFFFYIFRKVHVAFLRHLMHRGGTELSAQKKGAPVCVVPPSPKEPDIIS